MCCSRATRCANRGMQTATSSKVCIILVSPARRRLQPVQDTQEKQLALWRDFVLDFCRHHEASLPRTDMHPRAQE